jgi:hypothetical protein
VALRARGVGLEQVAITATTGAAVNAQQWANRARAYVYAAFDADAARDRLAERVAAWALSQAKGSVNSLGKWNES